MSSLAQRFKAARRVGTPAIAIATPDQQALVASLPGLGAIATATPMVIWDVVRGWRPGNDAGRDAIAEALDGGDPASVTLDPVEMLVAAHRLPPKSILFAFNAHRLVEASDRTRGQYQIVQAIANLRDAFKSSLRTLVLLGPSFALAPEIAPDVLTLDEPLPDDATLRGIIADLVETPDDGEPFEREIDAVRGLAAFPAEQAVAMSLTERGTVDLDELWERKRAMISATPGLSVWQGGERFDDVGGCAQVKTFLSRLLAGKDAPDAIVFIDEIEKAMAGATGVGDSSGVSQGQLQVMLTEMQDNNWSGVLEIGPPGAAKSAIAKAIGGEAKIPTIALDLNAMKASLVGQSEERLRTAMKVIKAIGGQNVLVVATCNKINALPPELRRRFTMGTFFFDLPDAAERAAIWSIWSARYPEHNPSADYCILPRDYLWTGAEIRQCCLLAYRLQITYEEAAAYIVPVAKAAPEDLEALRRQADGRFLSASYAGVYRRPTEPVNDGAAAAAGRRRIELKKE